MNKLGRLKVGNFYRDGISYFMVVSQRYCEYTILNIKYFHKDHTYGEDPIAIVYLTGSNVRAVCREVSYEDIKKLDVS